MDKYVEKYYQIYKGQKSLKNKLGIKDPKKLEEKENFITTQARMTMPKFDLDFDGLKKIHKHYFEKIYDWAGQERVTGLRKETAFTPPEEINQRADKLFRNLKNNNNFRGLEKREFAIKAAHLMGDLNQIHPFPEGNGRTQRTFLKEVAKQAGHELDFSQITQERMIQASIEFSQGKNKKMEEIFIEATNKEMLADLKKFNNALINSIEGNREEQLKEWNKFTVIHAHLGNIYEGRFMGQTGDALGIQLNNSFVVFNQKDMQHLDIQNPRIEQNIKLAIPDEFGLTNVNRYENAEKARSGRVYTGEVIGVTEANIYQQTRLGKIIEHDIEKIKDFEPSDVGKEVKIVYGSYGKGFVDKDELEADNQKDYQRGLGD